VAEPVAVVVEPAPVEPQPVPEVVIAVQPEPVVPAPAVNVTANLEQAGLVMIETAATRSQSAAPIELPKPQLGRKPKAPVVVADEPLQMVETRHD
jgi:fused signal recognition particle receptor